MLDIDEQLSAMVQGAIESGCLLSVQPRAVSELLHQARTWKDEAEKQRAEVERLRAEVSIRGPEGTDWISTDDRLPAEDGHYLVWVPEWEGYGNIAHADMCWWGGHGWHMGCLPSVEDGAPVSHWATITVPKEDK